jgi:hypothetical protein
MVARFLLMPSIENCAGCQLEASKVGGWTHAVDELLNCQDFARVPFFRSRCHGSRRTPSHEGNKVEQRFRFVSSFLHLQSASDTEEKEGAYDVIRDSNVSRPFTQLATIGVDEQRHVSEHWRYDIERRVECEVLRSRREPFLLSRVRSRSHEWRDVTYLSSQDVSDSHLMVVDNVCKVVRGESVRLAEHKVLDGQRGVGDGIIDQIVLYQSICRALSTPRQSCATWEER